MKQNNHINLITSTIYISPTSYLSAMIGEENCEFFSINRLTAFSCSRNQLSSSLLKRLVSWKRAVQLRQKSFLLLILTTTLVHILG